jgi:chromosome segregation ATPase
MTSEELLARLDERQQAMDEKIDAILEQTKKTNGRLLTAEEKIQGLSTWRAEIKAQLKLLVAVGSVLGIILSYIFSRL